VGPEEVRRAVLEASAELFARNGVSAVSLRDIASAADVHVSLITKYFGSREALIREVFEALAVEVARDVVERPREQHTFDREAPLGRWLSILAHWMLTGQDTSALLGDANPVQAMASVIVEHNGLEPREARIRAAQIFSSALGWRLFEPYLIAAAGLQDEPVEQLHDELTAIHQRVGATPVRPQPHQPLS
jgi:AcrR family transcriptional regulator